MSILSGFKKVKNYILTSSGYQLLSRWTSSQTVEFDDGKTAQTKLGDINGIAKTYIDMQKTTDSSVAASAKAVMEGLSNISDLTNVSAKNVTFDNSNTGLSAKNAQEAITEVNGKLMRMINLAFTTDNMGEYIIVQKIIPIFMTTNNSEYYPKFEFYNYNNDIKVRVTNFSSAEYKIIPEVYFNCNLYYFDI